MTPGTNGSGLGPEGGEGSRNGAGPHEGSSVSARLFRTGVELAEAASLDGALSLALEEICAQAGWPVGHALLRPAAGWGAADPEARWHLVDPERHGPFRTASDELVAVPGMPDGTSNGAPAPSPDPLLRRVVDSRFPAFAHRLEEDLHPLRAGPALEAGLRGAYAFPILAGGDVAAILEFFSEDPEVPGRGARKVVDYIRTHLELLADRDRTRRAARRAVARARHVQEQLDPTVVRLQEMEERYSLLCRGAEQGLWDWDLRLDRVHFSPRWKAILGYSAVQVGDRPSEWLDRIHPDDRERVRLELSEHLEWKTSRLESEHRVLHEDGSYRWVRVQGLALRSDDEEPYRLAGSLADVTDRKVAEERSIQELLYNRLTGFGTYALFIERLGHTIRRNRRRLDRMFAVLTMNLDGLQEASDTMGAGATNEILQAIARRLSAQTRLGDTVAHGRASHFLILLDDIQSSRDAVRIAQRLEGGLSQPIPLYDEEVFLTPHVGIALGLSRYETPEELVRDAGLALQEARKRGVGIEVFDAEATSYDRARSELEGDLRAAMEREELFLEYQPIVSLDDGRITGLEAFLRWNHPMKGPIAPEQFLPLAEEGGFLNELGYWVLERACRQMRDWETSLGLDHPPSLAVNITRSQLFDPDLTARAMAALKSAELDFGLLRFDIAEEAFMFNPPKALHVLTGLRARGIRVAVDDFGTGCSSLGYLHRFPVSVLKIDRSFVSGGGGKSRDWEVAETIVRLAGILGLEVIAEGIETREQCVRLRNMGCQQAQGYFFSGPVAAEDASRMIRNGYPLDLTAPRG